MMKRWLIAVLLGVCLWPVPAAAKRVICIDNNDDGFCYNSEGYWRTQVHIPPDIILIGGSLTEHLAQVQSGDSLTIACHSSDCLGGRQIKWNGQYYSGFGDGPEDLPLPAGFNQLTQVSLTFQSCYSTLVESNTTLVKKLLDAMSTAPNNRNTGTGFLYKVQVPIDQYLTGGTDTERQQATNQLNAHFDEWVAHRPVNTDPPTTGTQQYYAQQIVDAALGPGVVTVSSITYYAPEDDTIPGPELALADSCGPPCGRAVMHRIPTAVFDRPDDVAVQLTGPWPNPTHSQSAVYLTLSVASPVTIGLYDLAGRRMAT